MVLTYRKKRDSINELRLRKIRQSILWIIEPWQMNSNAALKIPKAPKKRGGRFRGNSKRTESVAGATDPKKQ